MATSTVPVGEKTTDTDGAALYETDMTELVMPLLSWFAVYFFALIVCLWTLRIMSSFAASLAIEYIPDPRFMTRKGTVILGGASIGFGIVLGAILIPFLTTDVFYCQNAKRCAASDVKSAAIAFVLCGGAAILLGVAETFVAESRNKRRVERGARWATRRETLSFSKKEATAIAEKNSVEACEAIPDARDVSRIGIQSWLSITITASMFFLLATTNAMQTNNKQL